MFSLKWNEAEATLEKAMELLKPVWKMVGSRMGPSVKVLNRLQISETS